MMKRHFWLVAALSLLCALTRPAAAETVVEVWRGGGFGEPDCVSADPTDGSCWVADFGHDQVVHLSAGGQELLRQGGFEGPWSVCADPTDGSCWVADSYNSQVVHLSSEGQELLRKGGFYLPSSVSVNASDGSCWVADLGNSQVVHLSAEGAELLRKDGFALPNTVSVDPVDSSCWVADTFNDQVVHLSAGGEQLLRKEGFSSPTSVSANPTDGSCWVADWKNSEIVHLSAEGQELWRGGGFNEPFSVSANSTPTDGSCWVADSKNSQVVRLSAEGQELWRGGGFNCPASVSVDPTDGSCWVADTDNSQVVHLAFVDFIDVLPSYWAFAHIRACFYAGIVGGYWDGTYRPGQAVTRDQMAVFVSRALAGGDALVPSGPATATFPDVATSYWAFRYIEYCYAQGVVTGYWDGYHPEDEVNRAQMAVYVARAMVGGDENVPDDPDGTSFFPDVLGDHWAYKYIEYCHDHGVVAGYWDGYHPDEVVNRAQMAVYVQRAFDLPM